VRPETGRAAKVLAAYVTLERLDVHVRDLVLFQSGFVEERLVAQAAREVARPVMVPAVYVQAHGRLESAAAHLAHGFVVEFVPESDVVVQVVLVLELGQTQIAVQVHRRAPRVLVELQVERVAHFRRERLVARLAVRRLDLVARVSQHVYLALEARLAHAAPVHGGVAERFPRTVRVHQMADDGRAVRELDAAQRAPRVDRRGLLQVFLRHVLRESVATRLLVAITAPVRETAGVRGVQVRLGHVFAQPVVVRETRHAAYFTARRRVRRRRADVSLLVAPQVFV